MRHRRLTQEFTLIYLLLVCQGSRITSNLLPPQVWVVIQFHRVMGREERRGLVDHQARLDPQVEVEAEVAMMDVNRGLIRAIQECV